MFKKKKKKKGEYDDSHVYAGTRKNRKINVTWIQIFFSHCNMFGKH